MHEAKLGSNLLRRSALEDEMVLYQLIQRRSLDQSVSADAAFALTYIALCSQRRAVPGSWLAAGLPADRNALRRRRLAMERRLLPSWRSI